MTDRALKLLIRRANKFEENARIHKFCISLIQYVKDVWINGQYCKQDWNIFNIDCQKVPVTNNGNEGTNNRLSTLFGVHPQLYKFVLMVVKELQESSNKVDAVSYTHLTLPTNREV